MTTIVIFCGERHEYRSNEAAAHAIRKYQAGHDHQTAEQVIHAVQAAAKRAADNGQRAEIMVTHLD